MKHWNDGHGLSDAVMEWARPDSCSAGLSARQLAALDALRPQVRWATDASGTIRYVDRCWRSLTGYGREAALGHALSAFVHPDDLCAYLEMTGQADRNLEPYDIRFRLRLADDSYRWFRSRASAMPGHNGALQGRVGVLDEVHEQILTEQRLRQREAHYRHAIELSPQMHWTADANGSMIEISARWTRLTGREIGQSLGYDWLQSVHPDDLAAVAGIIESGRRTGVTKQTSFRVRTADGSYRWMRARGSARRDGNGAIVRWHGSTEDINEQVVAEQALRESEENYRHTIELSPQIPWTADAKGNILEIGPRWLELMGMSREETVGEGWSAALHPDDVEQTISAWSHSIATGEPLDLRYRLRLEDGTYNWFRVRAGARRGADGEISRWYGLAENIQEQVSAELGLKERQQELLRSESRFRLIALATNDLLWDWDNQTDRLTWNEILQSRYGYSADQLESSGAWWKDHIHPDDRDRVVADVTALFEGTDDHYSGEYRFRRADGTYANIFDRGYLVRDENGAPVRMVGALQDLTARKEAEEQLRWSATHDALTHLPNRHLFQERLGKAIRRAASRKQKLGILQLDIDHFKQVNDTLGHDAGDSLLKTLAERLRAAVRPMDTVARLGGDELAIILPDVASDQDIPALVESIQSRLREPFVYRGRVLDCRASIGISIFPEHGASPDELLQNADLALYAAKTAGRGGFMLFKPEQRRDLQQRSMMIKTARSAVADGRIVPFYQPKIELGSGKIAGFEALLRWRDGRGRLKYPETIAAAFEDLELAADISDRIIDQAIGDMRGWLDRGIDFGHVAINAAAAEFRRDQFAEHVLERLFKAGIPSKHLEVEVTETVFIGRGADYVERALRLLSSEQVRIALDDFGTGYASLHHLKQFPVDVMKIDHSFVRAMNDDASDAAIVRAVINLGESLGMDVVAEGVETQRQAKDLQALGCKYGQGYLFSKAVSARQVPKLLS